MECIMKLDEGDTRIIIAEGKRVGLLKNQMAYVLATTYHETARTMKPVKEAFWLSESWRQRNLRYYPYYGRGYVQLTWKENYAKAEKIFKKPFTSNPDYALEPKWAAAIMITGMMEGWFGKKLTDYVNGHTSNYREARRSVNIMDRAELIAGYASEYEKLLTEEGYGEKKKFSWGNFFSWVGGNR